MWTCLFCGEEVSDSCDVCSNCSTPHDGIVDPHPRRKPPKEKPTVDLLDVGYFLGSREPECPWGPPASDPTPPGPLKNRLARFLHCDEDDLDGPRDDRNSKMEFWSDVPLGPKRHKPKSPSFIRRILERIRKLVRG